MIYLKLLKSQHKSIWVTGVMHHLSSQHLGGKKNLKKTKGDQT